MSDSVQLAQSFVSMQADSTRQQMQMAMLRKQAESDRSIVALLDQAASAQQASLPAGQGRNLDVTA